MKKKNNENGRKFPRGIPMTGHLTPFSLSYLGPKSENSQSRIPFPFQSGFLIFSLSEIYSTCLS